MILATLPAALRIDADIQRELATNVLPLAICLLLFGVALAMLSLGEWRRRP